MPLSVHDSDVFQAHLQRFRNTSKSAGLPMCSWKSPPVPPEVPVPPSSLSHPSRPKCCLQVKGRLATFGKSGEPALCHTHAPPTSIYSFQLRAFHDLHEFNLQRMCISCSCVCQCGTSQRFLQLSDLGGAYEAVRVLCKAVVRDVRQFFQVQLLASG